MIGETPHFNAIRTASPAFEERTSEAGQALKFLGTLLDEMAGRFPDAYLHIGGDENDSRRKKRLMKKNALVAVVVTLSICFGMPVASSTGGAEQMTTKMLAGQGKAADDRWPVSTDVNDSDEFFQNAVRPGPERDNSQKIEALLARMTLE